MRVMVVIPEDIWPELRRLAEAEFRTPRQQVGLIVHEALARLLQSPAQPVEASIKKDGPL